MCVHSKPSCQLSALRTAVPVFEKAAEAEGDELECGLNHEGGAEEVITVLQSSFERLRREKESEDRKREREKGI